MLMLAVAVPVPAGDRAWVPRDVPLPQVLPVKKATFPLGVAWLVTVAVSVTDCPKTDGFGEDARLVVVCSRITSNAALERPINPDGLVAVRR
jgi:hypothetical protein